MSTQQCQDEVHPRRAESNERFVAFAFAASELVAEIDADFVLTYAAGAFRTRLGQAPETFVGRPVRDLVSPVDHEALQAALSSLGARGRLPPFTIRLANAEQTHLAVAGIALSSAGRPARLCLTFSRPPMPIGGVLRAANAHTLARATEARLRSKVPCDLGLLQVVADNGVAIVSSEAIGHALDAVSPNAFAGELAPGRFGLLGGGGNANDLLSVASMLEASLRAQGVEIAVAAHHLPLMSHGLTQIQAARALRHALNVFARAGAGGLSEAGFGDGLAGYVKRAGIHTGALRRAIRDGRFELLFQPIVTLADRKLHHYEALIRPKPIPDCPLAGPQDFVMMVEAVGLADELDLAVARVACAAAAAAGVSVAFNLSGQSVQSAAFRARLLDLLATSPARKAGLLVVEMTETAEIEDAAEAARTAEALRAIGVPFCLDDFGAGAADVRLLRALTADVVKLDGSYVPGVTQDGRERALVSGMVEIARAVGAKVVAERVETEEEAEALLAAGVSYGQGWLFGRPALLPKARPALPEAIRRLSESQRLRPGQESAERMVWSGS